MCVVSYDPVAASVAKTNIIDNDTPEDEAMVDIHNCQQGREGCLSRSMRRTGRVCVIFSLVLLTLSNLYLRMLNNSNNTTGNHDETLLLQDHNYIQNQELPQSTTACAPTTVPVQDDAWGAQRHEMLFAREQIPGVSSQPNDGHQTGFAIEGLVAFDGRLHMAYGDMDWNTGPIEMFAWDPQRAQWIYVGDVGSEEIRFLRKTETALYAPETDAHDEVVRRTQGLVYKLECGAYSWAITGDPIVPSAHNYDLAVLPRSGDLLVSTGSRHGAAAQLAISRDQGKTWSEFYRIATPQDHYSRIYFIGATEDFIFIYGTVLGGKYSVPFASIRYKDEDKFQIIGNINITAPINSTSPDQWPYLVPVIHKNEMIVAAYLHHFPGRGGHVASYRVAGRHFAPADPWPKIDETARSELVAWTQDMDPNKLLVLMKEAQGLAAVFRTDSLAGDPVWDRAILLDPLDNGDEYISLAILLNDLYLGTKQGNLYVVREFYKPA
eukprot:scaffold6807_cov220-Amphora_coffeaeformis.AAC.21